MNKYKSADYRKQFYLCGSRAARAAYDCFSSQDTTEKKKDEFRPHVIVFPGERKIIA